MKKSDVWGSPKKPLRVSLNRTTLAGPLQITTSREWPSMRGYMVGDSFYIQDYDTLTVFTGSVVEINEDTGVIRIVIPAQ